MRKIVTISALLALTALAFPGSAQADDWCRRESGSRRADCHYSSLNQCLMSVRIFGGACDRDHGADYSSRPSQVAHHATRTSFARESYGTVTYTGRGPACN